MKKIVFALAGLLLPPSASASLLPDFGASGGDSQSFSSMDSRGRIEAAQAPQSARSTGIQSDVAAAKVESITSAKFGEMKQNVANGTFNPQAAKASFAKELDKIPSSQMNNAEKATVRRREHLEIESSRRVREKQGRANVIAGDKVARGVEARRLHPLIGPTPLMRRQPVT